MARAYVGTSGWSYDHWRHGVFYPERLPASKWLAFLASRFDTVELNASFYRVPKRDSVAKWAATPPSDFRFAVKLWRAFTHYNRLEDPNERLPSVMSVFEPFKPEQRAPLLVQLPPQMRVDAHKLDRFLRRLDPYGWQVCVEFRNQTWLTPGVRRVLDDRGAGLCVHDMQWAAPVQEPNDGAPFVYVRRHGPDARYGGSYGDDQVRADARDVQRWVEGGRDVYVYYNNDLGGNAVRDGARLRARLQQAGLADKAAGEASTETAPRGRRRQPTQRAPRARRTVRRDAIRKRPAGPRPAPAVRAAAKSRAAPAGAQGGAGRIAKPASGAAKAKRGNLKAASPSRRDEGRVLRGARRPAQRQGRRIAGAEAWAR